jgi:hypothetical protein
MMKSLLKLRVLVLVFALAAMVFGFAALYAPSMVQARPPCCAWCMYCTIHPPIICWCECCMYCW